MPLVWAAKQSSDIPLCSKGDSSKEGFQAPLTSLAQSKEQAGLTG